MPICLTTYIILHLQGNYKAVTLEADMVHSYKLLVRGYKMKYYHGSTREGLSELQPFASTGSNLKEPLVYLTSSKQLALHYIWDTERIGIKMPMLNILQDGTLVFQEMFSGALEYFYKGVSGYIYQCEGDYKINANTGVPTCATSKAVVPITAAEYIEDVYESILSYEEKGTFIYERYEDLPQWRIDVIRGQVMRMIKRNNLLKDETHPSYKLGKEKFPQYWAEAKVLQEHNLL